MYMPVENYSANDICEDYSFLKKRQKHMAA